VANLSPLTTTNITVPLPAPRASACPAGATVDNTSAASSTPPPPTGRFFQAFAENYRPLTPGHGMIHKDYVSLLQRNGLTSLTDFFSPNLGCQLTKPGLGTRQRIRLALSDRDAKEHIFYLKRYDFPGWLPTLKRWLKERRHRGFAVYDFAAALTLAEKDITVPRPVAFGEQPGFLGPRRSFVLLEEIPGGQALERLLPRWDASRSRYRLLRDRTRLLQALAALVRRLHEHGFFHRDLYLSHIFICRDDTGRERLGLIDLQRVFHPHFPRRWRIKDLAQLLYSAREFFSDSDWQFFFREYFAAQTLDRKQRRLVAAVRRKARRIARHDARRQRQRKETP